MTRAQMIDASRIQPEGPVYLRLVAEHGTAGADWFDWFVQLDREAADAMGGTLSMMAAASKLDENAKRDLHRATSEAGPGYWRRAQMTAFRWMTDDDLRVACDAYLASVEHRAAVERMIDRSLPPQRRARVALGNATRSQPADLELTSIRTRDGNVTSIGGARRSARRSSPA